MRRVSRPNDLRRLVTAASRRPPARHDPGSRGPVLHVEQLEGRFVPSFDPAASLPTTLGANAAVAGDFTGDGRDDLVVTAGDLAGHPTGVNVMVATGPGTFAAAQFLSLPDIPFDVKTADFDRNGTLDFVTVSQSVAVAQLFLGNGAGGFTQVSLPIRAVTQAVVVADFNTDGRPDLAFVGGPRGTDLAGGVDVHFQTAAGSYSSNPDVILTHRAARTAAVGDVNRDGTPDLISASLDSAAGTSSVRVFLAQQSPSFVEGNTYSVVYGARSVALADFDRDGRLDAAVASRFAGIVTVLYGTGGGALGRPDELFLGGEPRGVTVLDANRDGIPDLAVALQQSFNVTVVEGVAGGGFRVASSLPAGGEAFAAVALDADRDGATDLATVGTTADHVRVFRNTTPAPGTGGFTAGPLLPTGVQPNAVAAGDFDADGFQDFAVADAGDGTNMGLTASVTVYFGTSPTAFNRVVTLDVPLTFGSPGPLLFELVAADINNDGKTDLVVSPGGGIPYVLGYLNLGIGTVFGASSKYYTSAPFHPAGFAPTDFDRDGSLDLPIASFGGVVTVMRGSPLVFDLTPQATASLTDARALVAGDFNRDGKPDLAVTAAPTVGTGTVTVYLGDGAGGLTPVQTLPAGQIPRAIVAGDWNGDGRLDLAVSNKIDGTVGLYTGNGMGTFTPSGTVTVSATPRGIAVGDWDGDAKPDLLVACQDAGVVAVLRGNGAGGFTMAATLPSGGTAPHNPAVSDFNRDGVPDFVVVKRDSNGAQVYYGVGAPSPPPPPPNTPPTVTDIPAQAVLVGQSVGPLGFVVGDAETAAGSLTVGASSSDTLLFPAGSVALGGAGGSRTLTLTPAAGVAGSATITVIVTDGAGATATDTFTVTVSPPPPPTNTPPTVTDIPAQAVLVGQLVGPLGFVVGDAETPVGSLGVTASSSNPVLFPAGAVFLGGAGANRTVALTPTAGLAGTATITVTVTDAAGATAADTFTVTVSPPPPPGNTPPTVSDIPVQAVLVGQLVGPLGFVVGDAETPAGNLGVTAVSSNPLLFPAGAVLLGGAGANRTIALTPMVGQSGSATITVTVTDGAGATATDTFTVTVSPPPPPPNTPPTVSDILAQSVLLGQLVGPLGFVVGDAETPAGSLVVTASSSDTLLFPAGTVLLGGAGANRSIILTPAAGVAGTATITVTVTDAAGATGTDTFAVMVSPPPVPPSPPPPVPLLVGERTFAAGSATGVTYYTGTGTPRVTLKPFAGAVRTAVADFNADGTPDLAVATGPGEPAEVRVYDGVTFAVLFQAVVFEGFTGGVFLSAGDVTGDGVPDLVVSPDEGGGPRVTVYDGRGFRVVADFFGIDDPNFRGGARTAVGDFDGDGAGDLVVAAGFGGGPRVAVFGGNSVGAGAPRKLFGDFFLFEPALRNGAYVAVGDVDGDGRADLIGGGGPGGGPRVLVLNGADLLAGAAGGARVLANFFAGDVNSRGGIRVSVKDLDGDRFADVVVGAGAGAGSRVTGYFGKDFAGASAPEAFAFDASPGQLGGVFVG